MTQRRDRAPPLLAQGPHAENSTSLPCRTVLPRAEPQRETHGALPQAARLSSLSQRDARRPRALPRAAARVLRHAQPLASCSRAGGNARAVELHAMGNCYPCAPVAPAPADPRRGTRLPGPLSRQGRRVRRRPRPRVPLRRAERAAGAAGAARAGLAVVQPVRPLHRQFAGAAAASAVPRHAGLDRLRQRRRVVAARSRRRVHPRPGDGTAAVSGCDNCGFLWHPKGRICGKVQRPPRRGGRRHRRGRLTRRRRGARRARPRRSATQAHGPRGPRRTPESAPRPC